VAGGAVYDALVGAAAATHGLPLATRDRRALDIYRAVGAEVKLLT
jgi:predicted nucleic acid-binding protein